MICLSIARREDLERVNSFEADMVEIRADLCALSVEELNEAILKTEKPCVVTYRMDDHSDAHGRDILFAAIDSEAEYVDLGSELPADLQRELAQRAKERGRKVICSSHDFVGTGSASNLDSIYNLYKEDCAVVKNVTTANNLEDAVRVMQMCHRVKPGTLISFAMGELGGFTRLLSLRMGAPFTYVAVDEDSLTAPGQLTLEEALRLCSAETYPYGFEKDSLKMPLRVELPCSKSVAQRMIIASALACGRSVLRGYTASGDSLAAIGVAEALGAKVEVCGDCLEIEGAQDFIELKEINVGESGLLTRMMLPLSLYLNSKTNEGSLKINGGGTLCGRNMAEAIAALESVGVECVSDCGKIPFEVKGSFGGGKVEISGESSSQIVTGFLMTLPLLEKDSTLVVRNPKSLPYIYLTIEMLREFGIEVNEPQIVDECMTIEVRGAQRFKAVDRSIEKDWSAAVPFVVMGLISGEGVRLEGLREDSLQADKSILEIVRLVGGEAKFENGVLSVKRRNESLKPFRFDATHCPDIIPMAALLAMAAEGESEIVGADRLVEKESNRAQMLFSEFTVLGGWVDIRQGSIYVKGSGRLTGGRVSSGGDHRMAMVLAMASMLCSECVWLNDVECVGKSFPDFFDVLGYKIK